MKSRAPIFIIGILTIALTSFILSTAEASRPNAQKPCKGVIAWLAGSTQGKNIFVMCLLSQISNRLNLSEEQREQVKDILTAEAPVVQPLVRQLFENRQDLESISAGGRFDEAEVRSIAQKQATVIVELIVVRERVKSEIYAILTPEQREKLQALHAVLLERIQDWFSQ
jgi:Spy/CpxP family protein refolding chaperone